ncbi:Uncharacterised protein [Brucella anthropi]|nr:hypothetical protein DR92_426 [Brucella anthropi]SUA67690.1 Uncharacterised protein [Brucella anthropi]
MELFDRTDPAWPPDPTTVDLADGEWVTTGQAASLARVDERTIARWVRQRDISITVFGRRWINRRRLFGQ